VPPVFDFTASANLICTYDTVQFSDYSIGATSYLWFFPGGTPFSDTVPQPTVIYGSTGTFDVTLIASNISGSDTVIQTAFINVSDRPVAAFSSDIDTAYLSQGGQIQFTDSSSNTVSYYWDFGDGQSDTSQNPTHIYTATGAYAVILTASNPACDDQTSKTVYVLQSTGVDETTALENNFIKVFPNPFYRSTQIEYKLSNSISSQTKIFITDILGKTVFEMALNNAQGIITFNRQLVNGIYFVNIINEYEIITPVKLIKME